MNSTIHRHKHRESYNEYILFNASHSIACIECSVQIRKVSQVTANHN